MFECSTVWCQDVLVHICVHLVCMNIVLCYGVSACSSHRCVCMSQCSVYAWVCTFVPKAATIQTLWSAFHHPGSLCVKCCVQADRKQQICKWFFPKIQSANTNRQRTHRHSRIDNHSLRWHRTELHPRRQHETTFSRKRIHIWDPSFQAYAWVEQFCLCQVTRRVRPDFKLYNNWGISKSWLLKVSVNTEEDTFSVSVLSPQLTVIGTEHEQKRAAHSHTFATIQFNRGVSGWNTETHK